MRRFAPVLWFASCLPLAVIAQPVGQWGYTPVIGAEPMQTYLTLVHGTPETGAVQALITCAIGANWSYADVLLATGIDGLPDGGTVTLGLQGNGLSLEYGATVVGAADGLRGVRTAVPLDDPFWDLMAGPNPVTYGLSGRQPETLETQGARNLMLAFRSDCENVGDLRPPRAKR